MNLNNDQDKYKLENVIWGQFFCGKLLIQNGAHGKV